MKCLDLRYSNFPPQVPPKSQALKVMLASSLAPLILLLALMLVQPLPRTSPEARGRVRSQNIPAEAKRQ
jgi:hypothetical protein